MPDFERLHLENTGISTDYLECVNTARFYGNEFASGGGKVEMGATKGEEPVYSHVIEPGEGGRDVIFGPYMPFPAGNYMARFLFEASGIAPRTGISFDVCSAAGTVILARRELDSSAAAETGEIILQFNVKEAAEFLEFRSFLEGGGRLKLSSVEVYPDIERNTLDKARLLKSLREEK